MKTSISHFSFFLSFDITLSFQLPDTYLNKHAAVDVYHSIYAMHLGCNVFWCVFFIYLFFKSLIVFLFIITECIIIREVVNHSLCFIWFLKELNKKLSLQSDQIFNKYLHAVILSKTLLTESTVTRLYSSKLSPWTHCVVFSQSKSLYFHARTALIAINLH